MMETTLPTIAEVELQGRTVVLRPLGPENEEELFAAVSTSIAELSRWMPWCHADYSIDESRQYLASRATAWTEGTEYSFGIFDRETGKLVGGVGINFIDWPHRRANLGYWLRTHATGRGYASEAANVLACWALEALGLQRIEIVAAVDNIASQKVAERAGATREGILRNRCQGSRTPRDAVMFSFIPADFADGENVGAP
jgi:RimJ/RimL family protein N-acetyltransferase